jgi:hypothetical protein
MSLPSNAAIISDEAILALHIDFMSFTNTVSGDIVSISGEIFLIIWPCTRHLLALRWIISILGMGSSLQKRKVFQARPF